MQRLKQGRKWKEIFPTTRAGEDNRAGETVIRKLERQKKGKSRLKSEAREGSERFLEQKNEESKMHLELKIQYRKRK